MKHAVPIREKHDGALGDRSSVRVWLRLLSCTMAIEKELQRRFAERVMQHQDTEQNGNDKQAHKRAQQRD